MNPHFHTDFSISDSLIFVRKSVLIYETIIFYVIEDMQVIVTRVLYSAMDISKRLLEDNKHIQ